MAHPSPCIHDPLWTSNYLTSQALAANFWSRLCSSGVSKRSPFVGTLSGGCAQRSDAIFAGGKHFCEADHFKKEMLDPKALLALLALFRSNGDLDRVISPSLSLSYKFSQSARTCCWRRGNKTWGLPHKKALSPALRICNQMMNARDPMEKKKDDNQDNQANYWISMDLNPVSMKWRLTMLHPVTPTPWILEGCVQWRLRRLSNGRVKCCGIGAHCPDSSHSVGWVSRVTPRYACGTGVMEIPRLPCFPALLAASLPRPGSWSGKIVSCRKKKFEVWSVKVI